MPKVPGAPKSPTVPGSSLDHTETQGVKVPDLKKPESQAVPMPKVKKPSAAVSPSVPAVKGAGDVKGVAKPAPVASPTLELKKK